MATGDYIRQADLYIKLGEGRVQCQSCAHYCVLKPGEKGRCGVKQNIDGQLYTLVYGKACAANIDPIEKKPFFHFLPGTSAYSIATVGCQFECKNCQNWQISQRPKLTGEIWGEDLPPEIVVEQAKAFVSWSGGKDSCLAYYRALGSGMEVRFLLNMATEDGARSRSHGLSTTLLNMQAQAIGVTLVQRQATWADYEAEFKKALLALKEKGVTDGVFGDIDLDEHRQWVEQVCHKCGVISHLPLWGNRQEDLLREFINDGFKAVIIVTRADVMGEEWLGREVDMNLVTDLSRCQNITPCGESGEYHTFVIDGPLFARSLRIVEAEKVLRDNHWQLEIKKCDFSPKWEA